MRLLYLLATLREVKRIAGVPITLLIGGLFAGFLFGLVILIATVDDGDDKAYYGNSQKKRKGKKKNVSDKLKEKDSNAKDSETK